ncbi:MBL fold metallo-hydrolase [Poritiphilus flavus]|uniref:Zn-dependent hydrolase n=1 Tax=Poritiphilus flavus TaxID=2697053 RepID=A0A6L9ECF1_9FLAO|nr:MBL fold metallo-hydrolase [Poritiphilus flavus]NAS12281.1 Zn-dependent hydrolase [Poritiphilus flavus]
MKIHYIKSACVVIESKGVKILCDPWLVDGEYYGSWCHYPPLELNEEYFADIDFIYVSHIHPDHFSTKTLKLLPKEIPVLIHTYTTTFLKANIERLGFKAIELPHNERVSLKNGVGIKILAADNCNPELCAKFMGCGFIETKFKFTQIDSLALIDDENYTVLNLNDCPYDLAHVAVNEVLKKHKQIDFLLVGYGGAGPYPQCFDLEENERIIAENKKKKQFLQQGINYIKQVKPKYYMPFAGTYTLAGKLASLQHKRGVPETEEAIEYFNKSEQINQDQSQGILLNTYDYFDLECGKSSNPYIPVDLKAKEEYINDVLAHKKLDYELEEIPKMDELVDLLPAAFERMNKKREEINFSSATNVYITLEGDSFAKIPMNGQPMQLVDRIPENECYVSYSLDPRLLYKILKGPKFAHWNNAVIGSHVNLKRVPNNYERALYYSMNFFHG